MIGHPGRHRTRGGQKRGFARAPAGTVARDRSARTSLCANSSPACVSRARAREKSWAAHGRDSTKGQAAAVQERRKPRPQQGRVTTWCASRFASQVSRHPRLIHSLRSSPCTGRAQVARARPRDFHRLVRNGRTGWTT